MNRGTNLHIFCIATLIFGCHSSRIKSHYVKAEEIQYRFSKQQTLKNYSPDYISYIPATQNIEHTSSRTIRVNFHFINGSDSSLNYLGEDATRFAYKLIEEANENLKTNKRMRLPPGNQTICLAPMYQYQITITKGLEAYQGVYCHFDDTLGYFINRGPNRNNFDRSVINKYVIGQDSILNIFIIPHHPDSISSPTYPVTASGIALGGSVKISGVFETGNPPWAFKGLLNHEIGHVIGLTHTWASNDGCDDTPKNPNCWNISDEGPCDIWASNNLMDYNAAQNALTPCQIGKIHQSMANEQSLIRKFLVSDWCDLDQTKTIRIRDTCDWAGAKDLSGHLIVSRHAQLAVRNRISFPEGGKLIVEPGGILILEDGARLHNACHAEWEGIEIQKERNLQGEVILTGPAQIENCRNKVTFLKG